ncbi:MAG: GLUG motif-containing protein [Candidatus Omnitrophota bacterium]
MLKKFTAIILLNIFIIYSANVSALALPQYSEVVNGDVEFSHPNSSTLQINATDKSIINYATFNIGPGESVIINLPYLNDEILNRVLSANPSLLLGNLTCNGRLILINEAGLYFGPNAVVDAGSLIASTRDITNSNFLSGNYVFEKNPDQLADMLLLNEGTINIREGGFGVLIAGGIENKGTIIAPMGTIALACGDAVTLDIASGGMISIAIDKEVASTILDRNGNPITDAIKNLGTLEANGGMVLLDAEVLTDLFEKAINLEGIIRANKVEEAGGIVKITSSGDIYSTAELEADHLELTAEGAITSLGSLKAVTLDEQGASFKVGGKYEVGIAHVANDDNAITLSTGDYSGETADVANIIIDDNALVNLIGDTIFRADSDADGTGYIMMNSGSAIVGNNYDLTFYASENSTLKDITGVDIFTFYASQGGSSPVYLSDPLTTNFAVTDFRLGSGKFNRFTGAGSGADPYMIYDVYGLQSMRGYLTSNFKLNNNVDASGTSGWNGGLGFAPVGTFTGTFDGQNYVVDGLYISRTGVNEVGLFGAVGSGGIVENLGMTNHDIFARSSVGSIVGSNSGTVRNCYADGDVSGQGDVGGFIGANGGTIIDCYSAGTVSATATTGWTGVGGFVGIQYQDTGTIANSYSSANVTSNSSMYQTGGLVGINRNSITSSYSTGTISVNSGSNGGGLVGLNYYPGRTPAVSNSYSTSAISGGGTIAGLMYYNGGTVTNCFAIGSVSGGSTMRGLIGSNGGTVINSYWDTQTTGQASSSGGTGLTTAQMMDAANFSAWDFTVVGDGTIGNWIMAGYPHLQMEHTTTISDVVDLQLMAVDLTADYILANNIDASGTSIWNAGLGFVPIGDSTSSFSGTLDGDDYSISNLRINRGSESYVGLFGCTAAGSAISDVNLTSVTIIGDDNTGSLVGDSTSLISGCTATGTVTASSGEYVGGLIGRKTGSGISNCNTNVTVTGQRYVGGLVGYGNANNSYALGDVTGVDYVGGFAGYSWSGMSNSYATGDVHGSNNVGGFIGCINTGTISDSYATGNVTGTGVYAFGGFAGNNYGTITRCYAEGNVSASGNSTGGLVGRNTPGRAIISDSYATGNVNGTSYVGGLVGLASLDAANTVTNSYSTGSVSGSSSVGGLIGVQWRSGSIVTNSYWNTQTSGRSTSAGGTGLTTVQMQDPARYLNSGWNFASVWDIVQGANPTLGTGSVTFTAANPDIPNAAYNNLVLQNGGTALADINATTFQLDAGILALSNYGLTTSNFTNNGLITVGSGLLSLPNGSLGNFTYTDTNTLASGIYDSLNLTGSVDTFTAGGDISASVLDLSGGILAMGSNGLTAASLINDGLITVSTGNMSGLPLGAVGSFMFTGNNIIPGRTYDTLTVNSSAGTCTAAGAITAEDFTISSGVFNGAGYHMTITGDWLNSGIYNHQNSMVSFTASDTDNTITSGGSSFNTIHFNSATGKWTLQDNLDVDKNLIIARGILDANGQEIVVGGNWNNTGNFMHGNNKVIFDGINQNVTGNNIFYDLSKTNGGLLEFENGKMQTVVGKLTLKGLGLSNKLMLRSSSAGNLWRLAITSGNYDLKYLDVIDADHPGSKLELDKTNKFTNCKGWSLISSTVEEALGTEDSDTKPAWNEPNLAINPKTAQNIVSIPTETPVVSMPDDDVVSAGDFNLADDTKFECKVISRVQNGQTINTYYNNKGEQVAQEIIPGQKENNQLAITEMSDEDLFVSLSAGDELSAEGFSFAEDTKFECKVVSRVENGQTINTYYNNKGEQVAQEIVTAEENYTELLNVPNKPVHYKKVIYVTGAKIVTELFDKNGNKYSEKTLMIDDKYLPQVMNEFLKDVIFQSPKIGESANLLFR